MNKDLTAQFFENLSNSYDYFKQFLKAQVRVNSTLVSATEFEKVPTMPLCTQGYKVLFTQTEKVKQKS